MEAIYTNVLNGQQPVHADVLLLPGRQARTQRAIVDALVSKFHSELPLAQGRLLYEKNRKAAKTKWTTERALEAASMRAREQAAKKHTMGPLNLRGPPAFPMPIEIPSSLDPFMPIIEFLKQNVTVTMDMEGARIDPFTKQVPMKELERGIVFADGRLDLCKQSLGPKHIVDLMAALRKNNMIRHFLIGNNCVSTTGAKEIADYIKANPNQITTWYLAGCHLTPPAFAYLVDAMVQSSVIDNVWLKRNPLGKASVQSIAKLLTGLPSLRTLDLENTELSDEGAYHLFSSLSASEVKNLYLNANGIGARGMQGLSMFLRGSPSSLQSLFLSCNPIGDEGIQQLTAYQTLQHCTNLKVLALQSCGLTSSGVNVLVKSLIGHPTLECLQLMRSKTATPHDQRENQIGGDNVDALDMLIQNTMSLRVLSLGRTDLTKDDIHKLTESVRGRKGAKLLILNLRGRHREGIDCSTRQILQENRKEWGNNDVNSFAFRALRNNTDIRYIDSYYRNAARSCGMKQKWDDDDPHWASIARDAQQTIII